MIGAQADVLSAEKEGKGWLKQWEFEQIPILNRTIRDLTERQDNGTITREEELELKNAIDQRSGIVDLDEVTKGFLNSDEGGELVVDEMAILLEKDLQIEDPEKRKYPKGKKDVQLYLDAIAEVKRRLGLKEGGRVGYQSGNMVQPNTMQAAMPTDQGPEVPPEVQNIDYETLRARLPQSITDDIVRLISTSAEAMEDFATIQSQQDINNFNQKYGVELVLPAEA
jgi:sigma54-dependent transcription regulator